MHDAANSYSGIEKHGYRRQINEAKIRTQRIIIPAMEILRNTDELWRDKSG